MCMTDSTVPAIQHRADRQRQRAIGNSLKRLYAGVTAELIPEDFLLLFEEIDRKRTPSAGAE